MNVETAIKFINGVSKAIDEMPFKVGKNRQPGSGRFTMDSTERIRVSNHLKEALKALSNE